VAVVVDWLELEEELELVLGLLGVEEVVVELVVLLDEVLLEAEHVVLASCCTSEAPWTRFERRVALTEPGRRLTSLTKFWAALDAPLQLPEPSAEEIWVS
jgi:hypothetical protein